MRYFVATSQRIGELTAPLIEWGVDALTDVRRWSKDHAVDVSFVLCLLLIVALATILWRRMDQDRQQQLELCQRAFDYTREQCEFIVRNRVMPR